MATVASPSNITVELVQEYWDSKLTHESTPTDIMSELTSVMDGTQSTDQLTIPDDALIAQVDIGPMTGQRVAHLGFVNALNQKPQEGDLAVQIGNEETFRTKYMDAYFNEFSHAVTGFNYGIHAYDAKPYGMYGGENMPLATKLLGVHAQEVFGVYRRQALLQACSQNLTASPVSLSYFWNPNFYIKNLYDTQQPAWSPNNTTYTAAICAALNTAGTGINAALDAHYMIALKNRAKELRIEPLTINGKKRYILTVPTQQTVWFRSLDISGSGGAWWTNYAALQTEGVNFTGMIGEWDGIIVVEDSRAPTLTIGGSAEPYTLTAGYLWPANNDERDNDDDTREVGFLLGKGALVEMYPEKIHHEYDDYNYKKWIGKGYFGMYGAKLRHYDNTTQTAATMEQRWSIACVFCKNAMYN